MSLSKQLFLGYSDLECHFRESGELLSKLGEIYFENQGDTGVGKIHSIFNYYIF